MTYDRTTTIERFLDATAAKEPTPGGGSVTALAGALAAAMGEMVLAYSVGKKSLQQHAGELKAAAAELHRARQVLLGLMVEDQEAYAAVTEIRKMPEDSPQRRESEPAALLACIRVPQAMAATAVAVLGLCDRVVDKVNHYLLSDLAVCADLAMATVRCASYNVRVNLNDVSDAGERRSLEEATERMVGHALTLIRRVSLRVWERVGRGG
jgi:formiminotetrahydrofolate cyclodeaminase